MKLIPSSLSSAHHELILLAPYGSSVPAEFQNRIIDPRRYGSLIVAMQKMRGRIYLEDGAIGDHQLDCNGRHRVACDPESWHLLSLDDQGLVTGCVRYREHRSDVAFHDLGLRTCALAECDQWGVKLKAAVQSDLNKAQQQSIAYVEVGGWALAKERRCTGEALRTALATYGLAQILGGCVGIATATVRNRSASILRRIGGAALEVGGEKVPAYYDPQYKCLMEIVRFSSHAPNPRYKRWIDHISANLLQVPVFSLAANPGVA